MNINRNTIVIVSFEDLDDNELRQLTAPDPYAVLRAKTEHLADLLGCTEQQAERLILDRIGN